MITLQQPQTIDVKNLCSRKLWELLVSREEQPVSILEKRHIEAELLERRHYVSELNHWRKQH